MPSVVTICNMALSHLGDAATVSSIDPPEGSAQAEHCARFYPQARDALLSAHPWNFATRRERLALLDRKDSVWTHRYALPTDTLAVLSVLPAARMDDYEQGGRVLPQEYQIEREGGVPVLLTDTPDAVIRYISTGIDPTFYPAAFTDALAWKLASLLCGPMLREAGQVRQCEEMYAFHLAAARQVDSKQRRIRLTHTVPWLEAR